MQGFKVMQTGWNTALLHRLPQIKFFDKAWPISLPCKRQLAWGNIISQCWTLHLDIGRFKVTSLPEKKRHLSPIIAYLNFQVMPFGLTNTPAVFQWWIQTILSDLKTERGKKFCWLHQCCFDCLRDSGRTSWARLFCSKITKKDWFNRSQFFVGII